MGYQIDWNEKRIIKYGLAKGTHYKVWSIHEDGYKHFYGWCKREEIKKILNGSYGQFK